MLAAGTNEICVPSVQVCAAVWWVTFGAAAGTVTWKVSEVDSPLVSVAVTLSDSVSIPAGTVPLNARVVALKLSQDGSPWPFACAAA